MCRSCHRAYTRNHYQENKQYYKDKARKRNKEISAAGRAYAIEYLRMHPCETCGNDDIEVLQFDHLDRSEKSYGIASMILNGLSLETIKKEIAKCRVLCANCHIKHTREQLGWWRDPYTSVYPLATNQSKG